MMKAAAPLVGVPLLAIAAFFFRTTPAREPAQLASPGPVETLIDSAASFGDAVRAAMDARRRRSADPATAAFRPRSAERDHAVILRALSEPAADASVVGGAGGAEEPADAGRARRTLREIRWERLRAMDPELAARIRERALMSRRAVVVRLESVNGIAGRDGATEGAGRVVGNEMADAADRTTTDHPGWDMAAQFDQAFGPEFMMSFEDEFSRAWLYPQSPWPRE